MTLFHPKDVLSRDMKAFGAQTGMVFSRLHLVTLDRLCN